MCARCICLHIIPTVPRPTTYSVFCVIMTCIIVLGYRRAWPVYVICMLRPLGRSDTACTFRPGNKQTNKQKFKVRQPQRAAKSKRPNAPSDGSKNNGIHTTKQEEYPSRHPTTDTANSSTSKQITSRRLIGVSKSNTIQSTNQAGCPVSPPHMYHPRRPAHQPRLKKQTNFNVRVQDRKSD